MTDCHNCGLKECHVRIIIGQMDDETREIEDYTALQNVYERKFHKFDGLNWK